MNDITTINTAQPATPATIDVDGKPYLRDAKGNLVPVEAVKPADLLMDETVRKITGFARDLSAQIARFKGHTFEDVNGLQALIDECLSDWSADSRVELRALVNKVFNVDKEGQINRAELFMLLRVQIADERWVRAMKAISDSIRVIGSRTYVRFYERATPNAPWNAISIDLAAV